MNRFDFLALAFAVVFGFASVVNSVAIGIVAGLGLLAAAAYSLAFWVDEGAEEEQEAVATVAAEAGRDELSPNLGEISTTPLDIAIREWRFLREMRQTAAARRINTALRHMRLADQQQKLEDLLVEKHANTIYVAKDGAVVHIGDEDSSPANRVRFFEPVAGRMGQGLNQE